ncbi:unnamed protein product [Lactuca saligna]|uniref:Uncharacterized protein n=1 Tax=Lactuca saligna TaxID=75948 RepID=A0AA35Y4U1_LACSI|nr:unnamed protein product [Lactuca saligna]
MRTTDNVQVASFNWIERVYISFKKRKCNPIERVWAPLNDHMRMSDRTAMENLYTLSRGVVETFGDMYLPKLSLHDLQEFFTTKAKENIVMEVENTLHMKVGDGESSYASNSFLQEIVIRKTLHVLKHTIEAIPGSFYGRLFPDESLHLVHSSYALHWLSKVPEGIENNKANIYMAKTSPPDVFKAYGNQFYTDFINFLQLRSKEVVRGGCMVLTFLGRSSADPTTDDGCRLMELLAQSLLDMVKEGLVEESFINSFNLPYYSPCEDEVRKAIHNEGSFCLNTFNVFQGNWDPYDTDYTNLVDLNEQISHIHAKNCAKALRAVIEPLLTSHFGNSINIDVLFQKLQMHVAEDLANKKTRYFNIAISLSKK